MKCDNTARRWVLALALSPLAALFLGCTGIGAEPKLTDSGTGSPSGTVSDALSLSALTVNGRSLSVSMTTQPLGEVIPYSATDITVTATPTVSTATVSVTGNTGLSNVAGKNDISIVVMAADRMSSRTYTVTAYKEGAALEFPVSSSITVSKFTVSGTCYGDLPDRVLVSFGGMPDSEATVDATAKTWSAEITVPANAIANGQKKQLTVEAQWAKGSLVIRRDFAYSGSLPGHSVSGTVSFSAGVPIPTGDLLVISATKADHGRSVSSQTTIPVTSAASYAYTLPDLAPGTYTITAYHQVGDGSPGKSYTCCSSDMQPIPASYLDTQDKSLDFFVK